MLKNSDSDSDVEVGHTHSGRTFIDVPLVNMFELLKENLPADR
jgi:hypothetical protein